MWCSIDGDRGAVVVDDGIGQQRLKTLLMCRRLDVVVVVDGDEGGGGCKWWYEFSGGGNS